MENSRVYPSSTDLQRGPRGIPCSLGTGAEVGALASGVVLYLLLALEIGKHRFRLGEVRRLSRFIALL